MRIERRGARNWVEECVGLLDNSTDFDFYSERGGSHWRFEQRRAMI